MANNVIGLQAVIDVTQFNQGLRLYINGMATMTQVTQRASTQINSLGVAASAGLGAALGTTAVNAVQTFIGSLTSLAVALGNNISNFESLGISLNFFAARALQEISPDTPLAQALVATAVEAQGLMLWVERLATLSPFTAEQVGNAFRTAQAYGLSLAAAQKLVPLLIDFAAVNSLSPELLQRIALAMAQIQARGKLASQEINQLANAGLPIRSLLVKALNVTAGELEKMLEEGLVPAGVAIQAVTGYLEDFGGAAERVTRGTLRGIISSLKDIQDISSRDLFGPMVSAFFPLLNQLIDIGNGTEFKAAMKVIGQELGEGLAVRIRLATSQIFLLVQSLASIPAPVIQATAIFVGFTAVLVAFTATVGILAAAIGLLVNPFTLVIGIIAGFITAYSVNFRGLREITASASTAINTAFTGMARTISGVVNTVLSLLSTATRSISSLSTTVIEYGSAVVEAFVTGILSAMGLLSDAMQFMGSVLAFWLQPGSPPRIAPDLDTWGRDAANEWLQGWLRADFDILSGISNDIGRVLGALVSAGQLDELSAPRILRALRTELARAVDEFRRFGSVSEATLNNVARNAGPASDQVRQLLRDYVNLAVQTDIVRQTQLKLVEITERYSAILDPLRKKLGDISELRQKADEQQEILSLQRLIANSGVSLARKQQAQFRIQEILLGRQVRGLENKQDIEETAAEKELKAAQKRQDAAQEALDRTKALIEVQTEQLNLYGQELQILEKIRKENERLAREARTKMLEQLRRQLEIAQLLQAELKDTIGVFKSQYTLADASATAAEKAAAALELQAIAGRKIVRDFEAIELGIDPAEIERIRSTFVTLEDIGIKGSPFDNYSESIATAREDTDKLVREINEAMQDIRGMFKDTRDEIDLFLGGINGMLPGFLKFRTEVKGSDSSLSDNLRTTRASTEEFNKWPPLLQTLSTAFSGVAAGLITSRVLTTLPKLLLGLTGPVGIVTALVSVLASAWAGDWFNIRQVTADSVAFVTTKVDEFAKSERWTKFAQDVLSAVGLAQEVVIALGRRFESVFNSVIHPILERGISVETIIDSLRLLRAQVRAVFALTRDDISQEAQAAARNLGQNIRSFLDAYWNPFLASLILSSRTVVNLFGTIFAEIGKQFSFLPRLISFALRTVLTLVGVGLRGILPIVGKALQPINNLILAQLGNLGHLLAAVIVSPFKLLGKAINFNAILTPIFRSFTTGFGKQVVKAAPTIWSGLINGLVAVGAGLGRVLPNVIGLAFSGVGAIIRGQFAVFKFLDRMTFEGFKFFVEAGFAIPKIFTRIAAAIRTFGTIATSVLLFVADIILSLVAIDYKPFYDFFNRIKPTATATMPILAEMFDLARIAFTKLTTTFAPAWAAFKANVLPIFTSGNGMIGFLSNITKIGAAIGGKFVDVFKQFKGVGPTVAAAFKGIGAGLRNLSLIGSIKILQFFDGLSKGILSFAGAGQAKLGQALAGIFQGAFKGITGAITGAPNFIGTFLKNLNLASVGKAAKIKGPVVLQQFFSTLSQFKPGNIVKGLGSIFGSIKRISGAFGGLLNPINLLISAIDFFAFAFNNNIDGVENRAQGFVSGIQRMWADLISGKLWQDISAKAIQAFNILRVIFQEFQTNGLNSPRLRQLLGNLGQNIIDWAMITGGELLTALREFWLPMFGIWIRETIENLGTTIGQVLIFIRDFIVGAAMYLDPLIAEQWGFFWTWWTEAGGAEQTEEWLQGIIDLVVGWITTSAKFLYDNFILDWLPAFVSWLTDGGGLNMILTELGKFLGGIGTWIVTVAAPWLIDKLLTWAIAFVQWLGPAAAGAIVGLGKLIGTMIQWIIGTGVPLLIGGVIDLVGALIGWISGAEGSADELAPSKLGEFLKTILDFFVVHIVPALITAGGSILEGLWKGFTDLSEQISATKAGKAIEDFMIGVQQNILNVRNEGLKVAAEFIAGVVEGFNIYVQEPQDAMEQWLRDLVGAGEKEIDANSPSEVTKKTIGIPIVAGIIEGIKSFAQSTITTVVSNIIDRMYKDIDNSTTDFVTEMKKDYTTLSDEVNAIMVALSAAGLAHWTTIRSDAVTEIATMRSTLITSLNIFALDVSNIMTRIKDNIVGGFTTANTEATLEVAKLSESIVAVLAGKGVDDQSSVTFKIKQAMETAGKIVGQAFVMGMAFVFTDEDSLNPLWTAVDLLITNLVRRLEVGLSPTPNLEGGGNGVNSQMGSRPATFLPSNVSNVSRNQEFNLTVQSTATSQGIIYDFSIMQAWAAGS